MNLLPITDADLTDHAARREFVDNNALIHQTLGNYLLEQGADAHEKEFVMPDPITDTAVLYALTLAGQDAVGTAALGGTAGAAFNLTAVNWKYKLIAQRGW